MAQRSPVQLPEDIHQKLKKAAGEAGTSMFAYIGDLIDILEERTSYAFDKIIDSGDRELIKAVSRVSDFTFFCALHLVDIGIISEEAMQELLLSQVGRGKLLLLKVGDGIEGKRKMLEKIRLRGS